MNQKQNMQTLSNKDLNSKTRQFRINKYDISIVFNLVYHTDKLSM